MTYLKTIGVFIALFFTQQVYAQDVLDILADKSCECIDRIEYEGKSEEELQVEFGLCLFAEAQDHTTELKEQYKIDFNKNPNKAGKKLGELVGIRMVGYCPEYILALTGSQSFESARKTYRGETSSESASDDEVVAEVDSTKSEESLTVKGKIQGINNGTFVSVSLVTEDSSIIKLYWFDFFTNSELLIDDLENLKTKNVEVTYREQEIFQTVNNGYVKIKIIKSMAVLD